MSKKIPWAFELYESGIMAATKTEALEIIRKKFEEYSKLSLSDLRDKISMWDEV